MKQLPIDAFFSYHLLSELAWSPDGAAAAMTAAQCAPDGRGYARQLWLYEGGGVRPLLPLKPGVNWLWDDGRRILLYGRAGDATVCRRADRADGSLAPAFTLPFPVSALYRLAEGRYLAVTAETPPPAGDGADVQVLTELPFYANGRGFLDGQRLRLRVYDEAGGTVRLCPERFTDVRDFVPLDGALYFLASQDPAIRTMDPRNYYAGEVWRLDPATGLARPVTSCGRYLSALQRLGGWLTVAAAEAVRREIPADGDVYRVDPDSGDMTLLAENDDAIGNSVVTDCRMGKTRCTCGRPDGMYFTKTVRSAVQLCRLRESGAVDVLLRQEGTVDDFDVSPAGEILLIGMYGGRPQELYRLEAGGLHRCSAFHDQVLADVYVAPCRHLAVRSGGWDIDGWVMPPKDFDPAKRYPAILNIHGGPRNAFGEVFYHEMQYWAGQGYFVFFCNPVGGSGRGRAFADILRQQGEADFRNVMDFTDAVLREYPQIDPARLGCTGGSYGGYLCNWILGHTDRFAAVATQRSISNWISFCGVSDLAAWFPQSQLGADLFDPEEAAVLWRHSPLASAARMRTPTLIIHSAEDRNCPLEQGLELYTALKKQGVPARMCIFQGENHELSRSGKPVNRVRRLREITDWMDRYLKPAHQNGRNGDKD